MNLKACPFCGGQPMEVVKTEYGDCNLTYDHIIDYQTHGYTVECPSCTCDIEEDSEEDAIKTWNGRYNPVT
jgi:Lar family restriction alleviation protein